MATIYFSFLAVWLFVFACDYTEQRVVIHDDAGLTAPGGTICQYPCQTLPPPQAPVGGGSGYPIYPPPPPPPPVMPEGQVNCSQNPAQCCNNSYNNNNNIPPPFTYVPVNYAGVSFTPLFLCSAMLLLSASV